MAVSDRFEVNVHAIPPRPDQPNGDVPPGEAGSPPSPGADAPSSGPGQWTEQQKAKLKIELALIFFTIGKGMRQAHWPLNAEELDSLTEAIVAAVPYEQGGGILERFPKLNLLVVSTVILLPRVMASRAIARENREGRGDRSGQAPSDAGSGAAADGGRGAGDDGGRAVVASAAARPRGAAREGGAAGFDVADLRAQYEGR